MSRRIKTLELASPSKSSWRRRFPSLWVVRLRQLRCGNVFAPRRYTPSPPWRVECRTQPSCSYLARWMMVSRATYAKYYIVDNSYPSWREILDKADKSNAHTVCLVSICTHEWFKRKRRRVRILGKPKQAGRRSSRGQPNIKMAEITGCTNE